MGAPKSSLSGEWQVQTVAGILALTPVSIWGFGMELSGAPCRGRHGPLGAREQLCNRALALAAGRQEAPTPSSTMQPVQGKPPKHACPSDPWP